MLRCHCCSEVIEKPAMDLASFVSSRVVEEGAKEDSDACGSGEKA